MKQKIRTTRRVELTIEEAFGLFIRKSVVKMRRIVSKIVDIISKC